MTATGYFVTLPPFCIISSPFFMVCSFRDCAFLMNRAVQDGCRRRAVIMTGTRPLELASALIPDTPFQSIKEPEPMVVVPLKFVLGWFLALFSA
jgi:hypothetical protein